MSTENEVLMDLDKLTKNYQIIKIYEINSEWEMKIYYLKMKIK